MPQEASRRHAVGVHDAMRTNEGHMYPTNWREVLECVTNSDKSREAFEELHRRIEAGGYQGMARQFRETYLNN